MIHPTQAAPSTKTGQGGPLRFSSDTVEPQLSSAATSAARPQRTASAGNGVLRGGGRTPRPPPLLSSRFFPGGGALGRRWPAPGKRSAPGDGGHQVPASADPDARRRRSGLPPSSRPFRQASARHRQGRQGVAAGKAADGGAPAFRGPWRIAGEHFGGIDSGGSQAPGAVTGSTSHRTATMSATPGPRSAPIAAIHPTARPAGRAAASAAGFRRRFRDIARHRRPALNCPRFLAGPTWKPRGEDEA